MKEQQSSEFPVSSLTYADLVLGTTRLDGMKLCAGCEDCFVLDGFCGNCEQINADLEARLKKVRATAILPPTIRVDRIDNGTVEFEALEKECPASAWAVAVIFLGAFCTAVLTMTVLWFGFRWLIGFCLEYSR